MSEKKAARSARAAFLDNSAYWFTVTCTVTGWLMPLEVAVMVRVVVPTGVPGPVEGPPEQPAKITMPRAIPAKLNRVLNRRTAGNMSKRTSAISSNTI
jgi:hypothetical protein